MRAILFDKDGTLIDFDATWSPILRRLAREYASGDEAAAEALLVAGGLDLASGRFRAGSTLAVGTSVDIIRLWFPGLAGEPFAEAVARMDRTFHDGGLAHSVLLPGVAETLAEVAAMELAMGVATNDATIAAQRSLGALGLDRFFCGIFGYDSVANPKPAPDMVLAFAEDAGLEPEDVVVVGDNPHDLVMAREAGAGAAIGVTSGNSAAEDLSPLADAVLPSIRELPAWLAANRG
jgi:phosphoglycolate phosphatase